MIPKIAHMIWLGWKIPKFHKRIIAKNTKVLQDQWFCVRFWGNKEITYSQFYVPSWVLKSILDKRYALAADFFRLKLVQRHWGIYIDCDHELIKPIPDFVLESNFFCWKMPQGYINNSIFWASKENKLLNYIVDKVASDVTLFNYIDYPRIEALFLFAEIVDERQEQVLLLDSEYLYPFFPGIKSTGITKNTFANSWYTYTWASNKILKVCNYFWLQRLALFIRRFNFLFKNDD